MMIHLVPIPLATQLFQPLIGDIPQADILPSLPFSVVTSIFLEPSSELESGFNECSHERKKVMPSRLPSLEDPVSSLNPNLYINLYTINFDTAGSPLTKAAPFSPPEPSQTN